jgi:predicted Holliday junction resolvase-like endonuclease
MSLAFVRPALPLHTAGPYVAAAYIVFVLVILIYVAIMAVRLTRNQKDIERLSEEVQAHSAELEENARQTETESVR